MPELRAKADKRRTGRSSSSETPVSIRTRGDGFVVDEILSEYVRKRLGFKLGKFAAQITRVTIRFSNAGGLRGGAVIACRIKADLPGLGSVFVESRQVKARAAFDEAADAHERAVRRLLEKKGRSRRPRVR